MPCSFRHKYKIIIQIISCILRTVHIIIPIKIKKRSFNCTVKTSPRNCVPKRVLPTFLVCCRSSSWLSPWFQSAISKSYLNVLRFCRTEVYKILEKLKDFLITSPVDCHQLNLTKVRYSNFLNFQLNYSFITFKSTY